MISISKEANKNYLCKVVQLKNIRKHPNADKLNMVDIDFQPVIIGLDMGEDDTCVYFPVESEINKDFLSYTNSFRDNSLNEDKEKSGFFETNCRVRAVKLRGEKSFGYLIPIKQVLDWANLGGNEFGRNITNEEFDTINGLKIVKKYAIYGQKSNRVDSKKKKPKVSKLIEGQFKFHESTSNFRKVLGDFKDEDRVSISYKLHGTSIVLANVLTKRKLSFFDRISKYFKANIKETEYDLVYSSRRVVKNPDMDDAKKHNHFYTQDIWGLVAEKYGSLVPTGFSLYGEVVGQAPNGERIQGSYDYGLPPNNFELYVYRITFTNSGGISFELNSEQIRQFCDSRGLKTPKMFFTGTVRELKNTVGVDTHEQLLHKLEEIYTNKKCFMCKNNVWEEGIVLRKENLFGFEAAKLKSTEFLMQETKELDKGTENIEDNN